MNKRILGLDLGTNSIGWAVVEVNEKGEYIRIIDCGVRIFPEGVEPTTIGKGDNEQSKNATRRDKRQMRRQFYRKRLRRIKLLQVLIEQNMCPLKIEALNQWKNWDKATKTEGKKFPDNELFVAWLNLNPYDLRAKALVEELTPMELGRIFYHLIHHRGFLSSRKGNDDPKTIFEKGKPEENILPINETKTHIKDSSLGSYLDSISYKNQIPYKTIRNENGTEIRVRGRYTTRDMYVHEFEKIWNVQSQFTDINTRKVLVKKTRELKGNLTGKRNANKISHLKTLYGDKNVIIGTKSDKGITNVQTLTMLSFKEFLAGKIEEFVTEEGDQAIRFKSNESVLFWQRPLRSQKNLLSNCRFENNIPVISADGNYLSNAKGEIQTRSKKPCPVSHPEFEQFRAYQFINNIYYGKGVSLTKVQKQTVLNLMNKKDKNFDFKLIPKELKLTYEKFNYEDKLKVPASTTVKQLQPLFSTEVWKENYQQIWHCFYFYEDNEKLFEKLKKDFSFKKGFDVVKKIRLKDDYSNISLKAIRNILPFLIKGHKYDRAVILGGVKNAFGKDKWERFADSHEELEREIISILNEDNKNGEVIGKIKDHLSIKALSYGFIQNDPRFGRLYHHSQEVEENEYLDEWVPEVENLRNPIVQQGLNETRRLVNALMYKYRNVHGADFYFDQIKVEMGRNLRNNKIQRQKATFRIRDNEHKNDEARKRLTEYGLQPSRTNIQKYLMYKELEERSGRGMCPYTGKTVSINQLLGRDNAIQIEHIIPYSVSLDDSFGNKTLCEANFNRDKGELTPYQFYKQNPDPKLWDAESWDEIVERTFRLLPYPKAKRFTAKKDFEKSSFIERQLNDSRYIAKKTVEIMSHVCKDVRVMPGQLTAELRHLWGLNNILQSVKKLPKEQFEVDTERAIPYYVLANENDEVISIHRKTNPKPFTTENELLVSGTVVKQQFNSAWYKFEINTPELNDGNYWAKIEVSEQIRITPKYVEKPLVNESSIVFKGKVEKGQFKNDTTGNFKVNAQEGFYWAKFDIMNKKLERPEKDKQPKIKKNQILLFGVVTGRIFKSYVYECLTDLIDGKYWLILDIDTQNVEFTRAVNPRPIIHESELLITTTIDDHGILTPDEDKDFQLKTDKEAGKYFAILEVKHKQPEVISIDNIPPKPKKGQKLLEGNIWVDKYTGEIKFDPKKNRDDHRHHAVDAITIALTEQSYLQRLSTHNANRKDNERGKPNSSEHYPEPSSDFAFDVKRSIEAILISHKKNSKALTKNKKGFSVRGQLHKENVFGKRHAPNQGEGYHRRTKVTELKNSKQIDKIVDATIRKLIRDHLRDNCGVDISDAKGFDVTKDAFIEDGQWRLFLPNNKKGDQVPIKKVRIKENIGNAMPLKPSTDINQWVNPRNNHHVLIYKDHDNNLKEDVVQFWTVVERQKQKQPVFQLPEDGMEMIALLEINDMFILGLSDEEFNSIKDKPELLSPHLYRVQKLSSIFYTFRHHLASTINNKEQEWYMQSFGAWESANPIKIRINQLSKITTI